MHAHCMHAMHLSQTIVSGAVYHRPSIFYHDPSFRERLAEKAAQVEGPIQLLAALPALFLGLRGLPSGGAAFALTALEALKSHRNEWNIILQMYALPIMPHLRTLQSKFCMHASMDVQIWWPSVDCHTRDPGLSYFLTHMHLVRHSEKQLLGFTDGVKRLLHSSSGFHQELEAQKEAIVCFRHGLSADTVEKLLHIGLRALCRKWCSRGV